MSFSWIQWPFNGMQRDTVDLLQNTKWIDIESIRDRDTTRDTKDTVRYRRDTGEIQVGRLPSKNTRQGMACGFVILYMYMIISI